MGKDQRAKRHGLDVRKNRKQRAALGKVAFDPAYQRAPKKHKGAR